MGHVLPSAILVTADVGGLYPSIPHDSGLKAIYEKLQEREVKQIPWADLVNMAEFVLKSISSLIPMEGNKFLVQPQEPNLPLHTLV